MLGCKLGEATLGEELGASGVAVRKDRLECLEEEDETEDESEARRRFISSLEEGCDGLVLAAVFLVEFCTIEALGAGPGVAQTSEGAGEAIEVDKCGVASGTLISTSAGLVGLRAAGKE